MVNAITTRIIRTVITCTDGRLAAIAPFYGAAPKPREAIRRLYPVVGSWPART